jgi:plastocyanin
MKSLGIALVVFGLVLSVAPLSQAQSGVTLTTKDKGGGNFVFVDSSGNENPDVSVPPGTSVTLTIAKGSDSPGTPHNLEILDSSGKVLVKSDDVSNSGDTGQATFTSPASGTLTYQCAYHSTTMHGTIKLGAAGSSVTTSAAGGSGGGKKSPSVQVVGVSIALVGAALLLRRK